MFSCFICAIAYFSSLFWYGYTTFCISWWLRWERICPQCRRSLGEGNGYPLQYSCMENPYGQRSLVGYSAWDCKESDTTEQMTHRHVHQILLIHQLMDTFVFGLYDYCWYECYCSFCVCMCRGVFLFVLEGKFLAQFIKKFFFEWMHTPTRVCHIYSLH